MGSQQQTNVWINKSLSFAAQTLEMLNTSDYNIEFNADNRDNISAHDLREEEVGFDWSEEMWFRHSSSVSIILCMAYTIVFVLGIVGNCFVVVVVVQTPRMRTVTNFFIVNLAFADILVLLFCLPATLISNLLIRESLIAS